MKPKRIRVIGAKPKRIKVLDKPVKMVDPKVVAKALGATAILNGHNAQSKEIK